MASNGFATGCQAKDHTNTSVSCITERNYLRVMFPCFPELNQEKVDAFYQSYLFLIYSLPVAKPFEAMILG
jgi:hypothetical protein